MTDIDLTGFLLAQRGKLVEYDRLTIGPPLSDRRWS